MKVLGIVSCLLVAPLYIIYKPPAVLIRFFQRRWPDILWHVPTSRKVMALTIDDAPSEFTTGIMQILKANGVTATFFIIGSQMAGREEILRDLIRNNNELGNHAMHDEPSWTLTEAELVEQIQAVQKRIHDTYAAADIEPPPNYFRPGSGFFNTRMRKILANRGHRLVLGSVYPHDAHVPFWRVNARHILSMARPGGIIICHDRRAWTIPMLQKVIPEMKRQGYELVSVTELLKQKQP